MRSRKLSIPPELVAGSSPKNFYYLCGYFEEPIIPSRKKKLQPGRSIETVPKTKIGFRQRKAVVDVVAVVVFTIGDHNLNIIFASGLMITG